VANASDTENLDMWKNHVGMVSYVLHAINMVTYRLAVEPIALSQLK